MMKYMSIRRKQIFFGLLYGFLCRLLYQEFHKHVLNREPNKTCNTCQSRSCPLCEPKQLFLEQNRVPPPYKPLDRFAVARWLFFDDKNIYDIINGEPKVKLEGHWKDMATAFKQIAVEYVNMNEMFGKRWTLAKFEGGYLKMDPGRGTDVLLDLTFNRILNVLEKRTFRVHLVHPLKPIEEVQQTSIMAMNEKAILIVIPVVQEVTNSSFFDEISFAKSDDNIEIILVVLDKTCWRSVEAVILNTKKTYKLKIKYVTEESSNFLKALQKLSVIYADSIILTLQEDNFITEGLLRHCRNLCRPKKQIYFPLSFAQFHPDTIEKGMPPGKPTNVDKKDHTKFTGYWLYHDRESVCAYAEDWHRVLLQKNTQSFSSRFNVKFQDRMYEKLLQQDYQVITAVEPNLYKGTHNKKCVKHKTKLYDHKHCLKDKAHYHGSKMALGMLYIKESMKPTV